MRPKGGFFAMSPSRCIVYGFLVLLLALAGAALTGCGGGGTTDGTTTEGSVSSLEVAEKVSVVEPQEGEAEGSWVGTLALEAMANSVQELPAESDYHQDAPIVYVFERSAKAFNLVNEILCMLDQSRYEAMLNAGPYKAQVDLNLCSSARDSAEGAGQESKNQGSSSTMPDYELWVVSSSRVSNTAPQVVKIWVHQEQGDEYEPASMIFANLVITEGKSEDNPLGLFTMNFQSFAVINGQVSSQEFFRGFMKTQESSGGVLLSFIVNGAFQGPEGEVSFTESATFQRAADGFSGSGSVYTMANTPGGTEEAAFDFAYDATHFLRNGASGAQCLSRTQFEETAWRYGLYNSSDGSRVLRNSGFPVKYVSPDDVAYYGWVGYWGVWFPEEVSLSGGETLYKLTYSPEGEVATPYELFISQGRLIRHTRQSLTLGAIKNVPLQYHEFDPSTGTDTEYILQWDGQAFQKTAILNTSTWLWESTTGTLDLSALQWAELYCWSQALGGALQVKLQDCVPEPETGLFNCTASDSAEVVLYTEDLVYPGQEVPAELACFSGCPDPAVLNTSSPYFDTSDIEYQPVAPSVANYVAYSFDLQSMVLLNGTSPVVLTQDNEAFPWGLWSGPLFEPTAANLNALACEWDETGESTCGWQAWSNLEEFYTWETGPHDWNHFTALKDSEGAFITFEPPLMLRYVHDWGDGESSTFYLEYSGFGELHGIPGSCVDIDTGAEAECGPNTRWVPQLVIPDGSVLEGSSGTKYFVKALEKEQWMKVVDASECSGLSTTSYQLPDLSDWQAPGIGPVPEVEGAPAVIGGVLQE